MTKKPFLLGRRAFTGSAGAALLGVATAGRFALASPPSAAAERRKLSFLEERQATLLGRFGDTLIPGAATAGLVAYVDYFLARPASESVLSVRYLPVAPPYGEFYRGGLAALDALGFADLDETAAAALARRLLNNDRPGWHGPPPRLFALAVRNDAVDVTYGTPDGFDRLDIPYLPHIFPGTPWREGGHD